MGVTKAQKYGKAVTIVATSREYRDYVMDSLSLLDNITSKMMMGEYIIYYKGKIAAYVCDDRFLVKIV